MKFLKLIPATAIALTAFTTFEVIAGYPSGYTKKTSCTYLGNKYYKLQKTDTPASYSVYDDKDNNWKAQNLSYNCATKVYQYYCYKKNSYPDCDSTY